MKSPKERAKETCGNIHNQGKIRVAKQTYLGETASILDTAIKV
jgi:hypothetical protein